MSIQTAQQAAQKRCRAAPTHRQKKYAFFSFSIKERLASEYGRCSGQVNLQTGEILASVSYGLFQYREHYCLNISNQINAFPYTIEDRIICAAKRAAEMSASHDMAQYGGKHQKLCEGEP